MRIILISILIITNVNLTLSQNKLNCLINVNDTLTIGQPMLFEYHLFNKSEKQISIWVDALGETCYNNIGRDESFLVKVYDVNNKSIPIKKSKLNKYIVDSGRVGFKKLAPGDSLVYKHRIDNWVDLNKPGRYIIECSKDYYLEKGKTKKQESTKVCSSVFEVIRHDSTKTANNRQTEAIFDSIFNERLAEDVILKLEQQEETLDRNLNLADTNNSSYKELVAFFERIGNTYVEIYIHSITRDRFSKYLKKVANKNSSQNQPILVLYGNNSNEISAEMNRKGNNLNIQFIGIHDFLNESPSKLESEEEVMKKLSDSNGIKMPISISTPYNFLFISAIEKYNEYVMLELERKYGIEEVMKILKK